MSKGEIVKRYFQKAHNAPHQRPNGRVADIGSGCMRLLCVIVSNLDLVSTRPAITMFLKSDPNSCMNRNTQYFRLCHSLVVCYRSNSHAWRAENTLVRLRQFVWTILQWLHARHRVTQLSFGFLWIYREPPRWSRRIGFFVEVCLRNFAGHEDHLLHLLSMR